MNYLAHIWLSGKEPLRQLGGFVADAIKGKNYRILPATMQEGILLHRAIDEYTDAHPIFRSLKAELNPFAGRYAAVVVDIYWDYLLASDFKLLTGNSLRRYSWQFNIYCIRYYHLLPTRFKRFIWHFISTNRLYCYHTLAGIEHSLDIMVEYRGIEVDIVQLTSYLNTHEERLRMQFNLFFSEITRYSKEFTRNGYKKE